MKTVKKNENRVITTRGVGSIKRLGGGGRGHRLPGALLDIERAPKKFSPEMLATTGEGGGGGRKKNFPAIPY